MATTVNGWPYVVPADHPKEYPATSQALASLLDTRVGEQILDQLTPAAGWAEYPTVPGLRVTKQGRIVVVECGLKPTSDTVITVPGGPTIATVPADCRPAGGVWTPCLYRWSGGQAVIGRIAIVASGGVSFEAVVGGTMTAASGYIAFSIAYRSAS